MGGVCVSKAFSVEDYRRKARRTLPKIVFDFLEGGADAECGLRRNLDAFDDWRFLPARLRDVSAVSIRTRLWEKDQALPVYISPTGLNAILRPGADAILARVAARHGIPFALSTASNMSIEEVARAADGEKWFQLYVMNRDLADQMVIRARDADYDALILTVDVPVNGNRERDKRNGFGVPIPLNARTIADVAIHMPWSLRLMRTGVPKLRNFETASAKSLSAQQALLSRQMDASFDWNDLARLREAWPRKLIVKGLSRIDDAMRCQKLGVDAVILSNHGGRQLDGAEAPVRLVGPVSDVLDIPVFFDSGVRRGSDVVKGLCLGASMVGLGRALLYALAAEGEAGADACLGIVADEITQTMALLGAPIIEDLGPDFMA
ncbi:MAG TPA: mandelate dehydrogenase [Hyphomonas atlantica]|uniref:Mandelate dehydrogenase n=1 Tax=Hyphomonas atlantica TaxID=1280948 RepID=A0A356W127_9PROT|nr:mandelate dehydrogenase [Hyphomonas atlantica]|tara:strand:+ start:14624 stop:15757 length:1134 start_codon:yes stop_codon:yes gene_type:complete